MKQAVVVFSFAFAAASVAIAQDKPAKPSIAGGVAAADVVRVVSTVEAIDQPTEKGPSTPAKK